MFDPEHLPVPSAPPYGDYNHTTPVVSAPSDDIAPPPPPLFAQSCATSHAFHLAIAQHDYDLVSHFITSTPTLATPNTFSCYGNTPLFTAVHARDTKIVRLLLAHGADVNGWSSPLCSAADPVHELLYESQYCCSENKEIERVLSAFQRGEQVDIDRFLDKGMVPRTSLMEAASTGQIAVVKLLMQEYGADDTAVAPDGQTALRLAATNKHREITGFLPARRLGTLKRIRFRSRKAIKRIKVIARRLYNIGEFFFWEIPRFVLWTIPKDIWITLTWKNAIYVGKFLCWRIPKFFLYRVPKFFLWNIPTYLITEFPWVSFGNYLWRKIKGIPGFLRRMGISMYNLLVTMVNKVSEVVQRFLSLLHTISLAIWTLLKEITLHDVWNGICDLGRAIFMDLPQVVWEGIRLVYRVLDRTLRYTLEIGWEVMKLMFRVVVYIPKELGKICKEAGAVVVRLGKEIIVYFWPKAMVA
ncbi:ankyrin [Armillaria solidipes]|uniref:Ankyrin n=1 Tax=Armillaria solidipes TaxID=1076256 RepID=A0A2H3BEL1_9AGAR|nr:ankyrin [Armillaria solidipes]